LIFSIIFLILGLVAISGCTSNNGNNTTSVKNYTVNGVSFNYPSDWTVINTTSDMIVLNKNSDFNTQLTIQILLTTGGLNNNNIIPPGNFTKVSNTTRTIDNVTANEVVYKSDQLMYTSIYFTKSGKTYIIMFQAPINNFEKEKNSLDIIVNNMTV
jgi:PsbP-like protein